MEFATRKRRDLNHKRVFGCTTFVRIDESKKKMFGDKEWHGVFVGYAFDSLTPPHGSSSIHIHGSRILAARWFSTNNGLILHPDHFNKRNQMTETTQAP
jgi:hypothetical protein